MREETVVVRRSFNSAAEWEHSDVGAPDADEGLPAVCVCGERGGRGGGCRIITCQLHVQQQSSGRWNCSNRTCYFPVSVYWTPRAALPGA